jgi:hypothetical protein
MAAARSRLTGWIEQHGKAYLSYLVCLDEISGILESGSLKAQEQQLRDTRKYGIHKTKDISSIVNHFKITNQHLPSSTEVHFSEELVESYM